MWRARIILLLVLLGLFPVATFAQGKQYAVLVGVENYEHINLRTPPLKYAVEDVTEFAALLRKAGYEVILMTDDTGTQDGALLPTQAKIEKQMSAVLDQCKKSDTVVLAFAGHGLQFEGTKDAYFCPQDAKPFANKTETLISMKKVYGELESSFAGVKLIFVDACRNDPDPGRGRSGLDADSAPPPKGVGALFSCSAGQRAFEHNNLKHGVFFHYVLQGLQGEAQDKQGRVTFQGLSLYVQDNVPDKVSQLFANRQQSPNLRADLIGAPPVILRIEKKVSLIPKPSAPGSPVPIPSTQSADKFVGKTAGAVQELLAGMKFHWCPAGSFTMGTVGATDSESSVEVTLSLGFWLSESEVTQGQWQTLMETVPWKGQKLVKEGVEFAASYLSHEDATSFCERLTDRERKSGQLPAGWTYVLPTEAQWEYACRAGTKTKYSFGDDESRLVDHAWYRKNTSEVEEKYAHEVGKKHPNSWGLRDMHGNVWEWCADRYDKKLSGGRDPMGDLTRSYRVSRGGSWAFDAWDCRSAYRYGNTPDNRSNILGFRVAAVRTSE